jgi:ribosomal protein S18 acetylase RimI-like enzyme
MSIRQLKLPSDLIRIAEIAAETWNYPDHPEWNVQPDEEESLADSIENYQKIWPFIRAIQFFSPGLRDFIQGHVWEEEGEIAGFTQLNRRGTTDTWYISAVGVRPGFRRRGIAQKLLQEAVDFVRERGGARLLLDVIEENLPAVGLYKKVGFENYTTNFQMEIQPEEARPLPILPEGYLLEIIGDYDWKPRFELMERITPDELKQFEPVEEGAFKRPFFTRLLFPLIKKAEGLKVTRFILKTQDGLIVANAMFDTRTRETGRNTLMAYLDPQHLELAPFLVNNMLARVASTDPGRIIEFNLPIWQEALKVAAEEGGFEIRAKMLTLGFLLDRSKG